MAYDIGMSIKFTPLSDAHPSLKKTAWVLALAGTFPFGWCTLEIGLGTRWLDIAPHYAVATYGACILSFLGGMYWMRGVMLQGQSHLSQWLLGISVIPSLIAWLALLLGNATTYLVLIAGFAGMAGVEYYWHRMGLIPAWFIRLRYVITIIVCLWLGLIWYLVQPT